MSNDTELLEKELRTLYASAELPAFTQRFGDAREEQVLSNAGGPTQHRRRMGRPLIAVAALAAVVAAGVLVARSHVGSPAPHAQRASLTVAVLPAGAQLSCTIAISALSDATATGFITFVNGQASFRQVQTTGNTYVSGLHRWVQITPQMVAPDGNSYVTATGDMSHSVIQVVDAGGTRTVLTLNRGFISPLGFSPQGIVLLDTTPGADGPAQNMPISLLDPQTGAVRALPLPSYPTLPMAAGASGSTGYQAGTSSVYMQTYDATSNLSVVSRYDLTTGHSTIWFNGRVDGPGAAQPVGETRSGEPIIQVAGSDIAHIAPGARAGISERTLLMTSPHHGDVLNQGRVGDAGVADNLSPLSAIDGSNVWLAGDNGTLWRYRPGAGLQAMAAIRTSTNGAPGVSISGGCA